MQNLAKSHTFMTNRLFTTFPSMAWIPPSVTAFGDIGLCTHKQTQPTSPLRRSRCYRLQKKKPKQSAATIKPRPGRCTESVPGMSHRHLLSRLDPQLHQHVCADTARDSLRSLLFPHPGCITHKNGHSLIVFTVTIARFIRLRGLLQSV